MLIPQVNGPPSSVHARDGVAVPGGPRGLGPPVSDPAAAVVEVSAEGARAAVANANRTIQAFTQALEFEVDADTKKIVIRLVDTQDHRVLRQVPAPEMLEIARALERMQTLLVRGNA
jgi:flagellar protein FlaG